MKHLKKAPFETEHLVETSTCPVLIHARIGDSRKTPIVFLPGGGHLGRVAYGHPGSDAEDFLDHWLARCGRGLIAVSYPNDLLFEDPRPDLASQDWARAVAEAVCTQIGAGSRIVLAGWSMGGKLVPTATAELRRVGIETACFVALAAMPPIPGLANLRRGGETLTEKGLWDLDVEIADGERRVAMWRNELSQILSAKGGQPISTGEYLEHYLCNPPINLRGEIERYGHGAVVQAAGEMLRDLDPFAYANYPLCACIAPTDAADARHALTSASLWTGFSAQSLYCRLQRETGGSDRLRNAQSKEWLALRALFSKLHDRLSGEVPGGHFFFIGQDGARQTADQIDALAQTADTIGLECDRIAAAITAKASIAAT